MKQLKRLSDAEIDKVFSDCEDVVEFPNSCIVKHKGRFYDYNFYTEKCYEISKVEVSMSLMIRQMRKINSKIAEAKVVR